MAKRPKPPPPKPPEDALRWFADKVPFTREEVDALDAQARARAFYVSNVAQLRLVSEVHKAVTKAIEDGTTLDDFKRAVRTKLESEWGGEKPGRVETIFRTNVQSAYNAGRLAQFEDPMVKRFRPFRGWSVVVDRRTTEHICLPLKNVVVPADSAFAQSHVPPLHFNCRTGLMALSPEEAGQRVPAPEAMPEVPVQQGFGGNPLAPLDLVNLDNEPRGLRRLFQHKTEGVWNPDGES